MQEFEVATFNKETTASGTKKKKSKVETNLTALAIGCKLCGSNRVGKEYV
jgi:hypothetical protein